MEKQWIVVIQHVHREGNVVADAMAKKAIKIQQGVLKMTKRVTCEDRQTNKTQSKSSIKKPLTPL